MPTRHDIEVINSSRTVVFRCKQCRSDFLTVDMGVVIRHQADGTISEFYAQVNREHDDAPPTKNLRRDGNAPGYTG